MLGIHFIKSQLEFNGLYELFPQVDRRINHPRVNKFILVVISKFYNEFLEIFHQAAYTRRDFEIKGDFAMNFLKKNKLTNDYDQDLGIVAQQQESSGKPDDWLITR